MSVMWSTAEQIVILSNPQLIKLMFYRVFTVGFSVLLVGVAPLVFVRQLFRHEHMCMSITVLKLLDIVLYWHF